MPLVLTEQQGQLRDSARDFLSDRSPVSRLRGLRDQRSGLGHDPQLWTQFAEMGFTGMCVPEAFGGLGLGQVEAGVVTEQIGRHLTASPFLASSVVAAAALSLAGSEAQKDTWLPRIASGEVIATLAVDEAGKHRPSAIALNATADGPHFVLDGQKTFVPDGHVAGLLVVAARTAQGVSLFLVEPGTPGLRIERSAMVDAHNAARLAFDGVRVPATAVLGAVDTGAPVLEAVLDIGRAAAASELVGIADEVFERTVAYLKERQQFGKVIGEFQALQHRAAFLFCEIELARAAVLKAQQAIDDGLATAPELVAVAKAKAGSVATLAVQEGVQLHGGMGMTDEFELGFFMKRARVLQELFGDASFHADRLAHFRKY